MHQPYNPSWAPSPTAQRHGISILLASKNLYFQQEKDKDDFVMTYNSATEAINSTLEKAEVIFTGICRSFSSKNKCDQNTELNMKNRGWKCQSKEKEGERLFTKARSDRTRGSAFTLQRAGLEGIVGRNCSL